MVPPFRLMCRGPPVAQGQPIFSIGRGRARYLSRLTRGEKMTRLGTLMALTTLTMAAGSAGAAPPAGLAGNPFLKPSALPFQAPPFDQIHESDYQPALEE